MFEAGLLGTDFLNKLEFPAPGRHTGGAGAARVAWAISRGRAVRHRQDVGGTASERNDPATGHIAFPPIPRTTRAFYRSSHGVKSSGYGPV